MKNIINYRALPIFFLMMIIGIITATFAHFAVSLALIVFFGALFVSCFSIPKLRRHTIKFLLIVIALAVGLISTWISLGISDIKISDYGTVAIEGRVTNVSEFDENGYLTDRDAFYLENVTYIDASGSKVILSGYVQVKGVGIPNSYRVGDIVNFDGALTNVPINPTSAGSIADYRNNVRYSTLANGELIRTEGKFNFFDEIKVGIKAVFKKYCGDSAGTMYAMLFGDKSSISDDVKGNFSATGMAHLLAVSGLHVGMLALVVMYLTKKLRFKESTRIVIMFGVLALFNVLCCFTPSVMRASLMIIVCYLAKWLGLRNDSISTVSCAAILLLVFKPFFLFDLSFIMSFMAVISMMFFSKPLSERLRFLPKKLGNIMGASLAVNFGMLPIMLHFFGSVSFIFVIANVVIMSIIVIIYPVMIVLSALSFIPYLGYLLVPIGYMFSGVQWIIGIFARIPFVSIIANVDWIIIIPYIIMMVVLSGYVMVSPKIKKIIITTLLIGIMAIVLVSSDGLIKETDISAVGVDDYENAIYLYQPESGANYLVINGSVNRSMLDDTAKALKKRRISDIEAVIKSDITRDEIAIIRNYYALFGIQDFYTKTDKDFFQEWITCDFYDYCASGDFNLRFLTDAEIEIDDGNVVLLFNGDNEGKISFLEKHYDIIFITSAALEASKFNPDYIVNNYGYRTFVDKCVPNTFTFKAINGNIKASVKV